MKFHRLKKFQVVAFTFFLIYVPLHAAEKPKAGNAFDRKLELQGIKFHVTCPNKGSINLLTIVPSGLTTDNKKIEVEIGGSVTGAEVEDLNADGSPEIYIYTQSAGSGSYGGVIAYATNKNKSLSQVTFPDLADDKTASKGYSGHDEFALVENRLVRRFKLFMEGDINANPSGKTRQIQYRLDAGEAGWILRLDKVIEF